MRPAGLRGDPVPFHLVCEPGRAGVFPSCCYRLDCDEQSVSRDERSEPWLVPKVLTHSRPRPESRNERVCGGLALRLPLARPPGPPGWQSPLLALTGHLGALGCPRGVLLQHPCAGLLARAIAEISGIRDQKELGLPPAQGSPGCLLAPGRVSSGSEPQCVYHCGQGQLPPARRQC